jgi:RNA polymerase sigma-70 factor, ECF subfamily
MKAVFKDSSRRADMTGEHPLRRASVGAAQVGISDEQSLLAAAIFGDEKAFAQLCSPVRPRILRRLDSITRNREDAEDALQDAFLRAFCNLKRFHGDSAFSTWLTRIAINSGLMLLRKKRSFQKRLVSVTERDGKPGVIMEIADVGLNPEGQFSQLERQRNLRRALRALHPTLRCAAELRFLQERSLKETAGHLGISVSAAKGRLFRASMELRRSFFFVNGTASKGMDVSAHKYWNSRSGRDSTTATHDASSSRDAKVAVSVQPQTGIQG